MKQPVSSILTGEICLLPSTKQALPPVEGYLIVSEAAKILGVSKGSVYRYIERRKLPAQRLGGLIVLSKRDLEGFQRPVGGRPGWHAPVWRAPLGCHSPYMLAVRVRVKEGQQEAFQKKLVTLRAQRKHQFPGTVARSISRSIHDRSLVQITLVWRTPDMVAQEEREQAFKALREDFEDLLAWEHATMFEGTVDLNT